MTIAMEGGGNLERAIDELKMTVANSILSQNELSSTLKELRLEISTTYVRKDVLDPTLSALKDDVQAHDDWIVWAQRIVLGLVIAAVIGFAFATGGAAS